MFKPKTLKIDLEFLETRCLLNGDIFSSSLLVSGPKIDHAFVAQTLSFEMVRTDSPAGNFNKVVIDLNGAVLENNVVFPAATFFPYNEIELSPLVANRQNPYSTFSLELSNSSSAKAFSSDPKQNLDFQILVLTDQQFINILPGANLTAESDPFNKGPIEEETPPSSPINSFPIQIVAFQLSKRSISESFIPEENTSSPRLNPITLDQVSPVKDQGSAPPKFRDVTTVSLPQAIGKEDHLSSPNLQPANASSVNGTPLRSVCLGLADSTVLNLGGQDPEIQLRSSEGAGVGFSRGENGFESRGSSTDSVLTNSSTIIDEAFSYPSLMTDILPFDLVSLETSIKDFFDHLDRLGQKISKNQINILYASGLMAVGAMLVWEIARRNARTVASDPVPYLAKSIPYSDYR